MAKKKPTKEELQKEEQRLLKKVADLKTQRQTQMEKIGQVRIGEQKNKRQSDRKFLENRGRAILSRTKKADKSKLATLNKIIKLTEGKLRSVRQRLSNIENLL